LGERATNLKPIVHMGARPYNPTLGRFLRVDPVEGGTENDYTYPTDPVNMNDLDGRMALPNMDLGMCSSRAQRGCGTNFIDRRHPSNQVLWNQILDKQIGWRPPALKPAYAPDLVPLCSSGTTSIFKGGLSLALTRLARRLGSKFIPIVGQVSALHDIACGAQSLIRG
jgi:RHS repeat-associated protein